MDRGESSAGRKVRQFAGAVALAAIAVVLIAIPTYDFVEDVFWESKLWYTALLENAVPVAMVVVVFTIVANRLWSRGDFEGASVAFRWGVIGLIGALVPVVWTLGFQVYQGEIKPPLIVGYALMWGCLAGLLNGVREIGRRNRKLDLERSNDLNTELRRANTVFANASSRKEIERAACRRLTNADQIRYAWCGRLDGDEIVPTAVSNVDLDDLDPVVVDRADIFQSESISRVHQSAGFESDPAAGTVVRIPVEYDETPYGALTVGIERGTELRPFETQALQGLGRHVGNTINALRSREALVSDRVVELTFELPGDGILVNKLTAGGGRLTLRSLQYAEDILLAFYDTTGVDHSALEEFADDYDWITAAKSLSENGDGTGRIQLVIEDMPLYEEIVSRGAQVTDERSEDGTSELRIHLPQSADVRSVVEGIKQHYPGAELRSRRDVSQSATDREGNVFGVMQTLTPRQLLVAETAYHGGYFDSPRKQSGEELASTLDISAPAFHNHLRAVERKLFERAFGGSKPNDDAAD